jgi:hypothetical protein
MIHNTPKNMKGQKNMANDITVAILENPIKNGTLVYGCSKTGLFDTKDTYVSNRPTISDIENKYDHRFDDPSYYYGGGNVDGGDVAE